MIADPVQLAAMATPPVPESRTLHARIFLGDVKSRKRLTDNQLNRWKQHIDMQIT
jgi:hypothetical protein